MTPPMMQPFMPWAGPMFAPPGGRCPPPRPQPCGCEDHPHYHSFCPVCCHPANACCCGSRDCRKEAKELVVPQAAAGGLVEADLVAAKTILKMVTTTQDAANTGAAATPQNLETNINIQATGDNIAPVLERTTKSAIGMGTAFIGGGCCVHLSIEYMPATPLAPSAGIVAVMVVDSDKTVMAWARLVGADAGYKIQEDIITTYAGAKLTVVVDNVIARVRWCEVFSC